MGGAIIVGAKLGVVAADLEGAAINAVHSSSKHKKQ